MQDRHDGVNRIRSWTVALAALAALAAPASAQAASAPTVFTGSAHQITYNSAVLAGSVNPNGSNTSYYFQYGLRRADYGGQSAIVVQGTLSGTGNANRPVILQADPFPYTSGFQNVSEPHLTTPVGSFSFPVLGTAVTTQFRVVTNTNPPVVSPVAVEKVAVKVD